MGGRKMISAGRGKHNRVRRGGVGGGVRRLRYSQNLLKVQNQNKSDEGG